MTANTTNKRIAKNTILLYFRLLLTMSISIYTSRVILNALGVEDFGIYNVVGGVIVMFSFISASMSTATSRFLTFELGVENRENMKTVFAAACTIHTFIAIVIFLLGETVGLWFLKNKLVIPPEREFAAMVVYQVTIIIAIISIIQAPYTASVFAHEKINIYAFVEILNAVLRLLLVITLKIILFDKLIAYSFMLLFISITAVCIYIIYCVKKFSECHFSLTSDKKILKPMLSFSGWDLYGNMSTIARIQGVNILLNIFFGPILNAANAIAIQIQGAVNSFASNLLITVRPQIVKCYAQGNVTHTLWLLENTVKLMTLLLLIICLPLIIEMSFVLSIWLGEVPEHTVIFCRLTLIFIIIANISLALMSVIHATGKIKNSSIINGTLYLFVIPITYFAFRLGLPPSIPFVINVMFVSIGCFLNMIYIKKYIPQFSIFTFIKGSILTIIFIIIISTLIIYLVFHFFNEGWGRFILIIILNTFIIVILGFFFALDKEMKYLVKNKILFKIWKKS